MRIDFDIKLDFSDVLLLPKRSELSSRSEVDIEREMRFKHSPYVWKGVPIIVSNMDTTGTIEMAKTLQEYKIITCLHKYYVAEDIPDDLNPDYFMISTGITDADLERLDLIIQKKKINFICVDVANGYSKRFHDKVKSIREKYPEKVIVAGNVVTKEMVEELIINCGVDIVKVGIGSGSVCTTRLQTGVGCPQFSAVMECADAAHGVSGHIISDGGIQNVGDFSKAFGGGADFVMCGSMFAGHTESGGELIEEGGKKFKVFYGMSSANAMNKYHGGVAQYRSAEGKCVKIPYKGDVKDTILNVLGGIRSTMTYIGAHKIKDIPKCASFIRVNNIVNKIYSNDMNHSS
jgi:GMP reductase